MSGAKITRKPNFQEQKIPQNQIFQKPKYPEKPNFQEPKLPENQLFGSRNFQNIKLSGAKITIHLNY